MSEQTASGLEMRRSQRVVLRVAIQVRWTPAGDSAITEDTTTQVVNAHGAINAPCDYGRHEHPGGECARRIDGVGHESESGSANFRQKSGGNGRQGMSRSARTGKAGRKK